MEPMMAKSVQRQTDRRHIYQYIYDSGQPVTSEELAEVLSLEQDAVEQGLPAPIPTSQIIYNQAIIDGIIRSCQCGREVEIHVEEI